MPIPKPNNQESKNDFMSRCMKAISAEYEQDQASAICYTQWDERNETKLKEHEQLKSKLRNRS
jgi:hypothetical protein